MVSDRRCTCGRLLRGHWGAGGTATARPWPSGRNASLHGKLAENTLMVALLSRNAQSDKIPCKLCGLCGTCDCALIPFNGRAHAEDIRGGCRPERQPQYAPRVGASLRLPQAAALARQAPSLHARGNRRAARRAPGGTVDLVGHLPCAGVGRGRHARARRRPRGLRAERADAAMEGALALRSVERSVEEVLLPSLDEIGDRHGFDRLRGRSPPAGPASGCCGHSVCRRRRCGRRRAVRRRDAGPVRPRRPGAARAGAFASRSGARVHAAGHRPRRAGRRPARVRAAGCRRSPEARRPTTMSRAGPTACAPTAGALPVLCSGAAATSAPHAGRQLPSHRRGHGQLADVLEGSGRDASGRALDEPTLMTATRRTTLELSARSSSRPHPRRACTAGPVLRALRRGPPDADGRAVARLRAVRDRGPHPGRPDLAPAPGGRSCSSTDAVGLRHVRAAEDLLGVVEPAAVNRHICEFLVPADAEAWPRRPSCSSTPPGRRRGADIVLRAADEYGMRYAARMGPCGPPAGALIVLDVAPLICRRAAALLPLQGAGRRAPNFAQVEAPLRGAMTSWTWPARSEPTLRPRCSG